MRALSWTTAQGLPARPLVRCASSTTIRPQGDRPLSWAASRIPLPREAYVAKTMTLPCAVSRTRVWGSVVCGKPVSWESRGHPDEGAGAAAVPPGAGGLVEEVQGGDQDQDAVPADLFGGLYGDEGLAAARGHDDLGAQAAGRGLGGGAGGEFLDRAGQGLALVRAQRRSGAGVGHGLALLSGSGPWGRVAVGVEERWA